MCEYHESREDRVRRGEYELPEESDKHWEPTDLDNDIYKLPYTDMEYNETDGEGGRV